MICIAHYFKVGTHEGLSILSGNTDLAKKGDLIAVGCCKILPGDTEPGQGERTRKGTWHRALGSAIGGGVIRLPMMCSGGQVGSLGLGKESALVSRGTQSPVPG